MKTIKNKKIKNILLTTSFFAIASIIALSTSLATYFSIKNNRNNKIYSFDGLKSNNFESLFNNVSSKYFKSSNFMNERYKWSINNGKSTLYFNNPKYLRDEIMKYINVSRGFSSYDIKNNSNYLGAYGELSSEGTSKIYSDNYDDLKQRIYRGRNNSIFLSEKEAKDSYLNIHDAYYFNNLYFRNKEQLELYLNREYYFDNNSEGFKSAKKVISVLNENNLSTSEAINKENLFSALDQTSDQNQKDVINSKKSFANFVSQNVNNYIEFDNNGTYSYYKKEDINSVSDLMNYFDNPDFTKLYSNEGKNTYIVDLDQDDKANLYGAYIISSTKDLEMMKDKNQWYKTSTENKLISKQKDSILISSIFDIFLIPDENNNNPINIQSLNEYVLNNYFNLLKSKHLNIFNNLKTLLEKIRRGKNYNKFYELILSYTFLINQLISSRANEDMIIKTKEVFNDIAMYIDKIIYMIFPKNLLIGKNDQLISFTKILNFKDNYKNLNTDINYYVDKISEDYPQFLVALIIMSLSITNSSFNGCAFEFDYDKFSKLIEKNASYKEETMEIKYKNDYKFIFDLFKCEDINYFYNFLKQNSNSNWNDIDEEIIKKISVVNYSKSLFSSNILKLDYFNTKILFPFIGNKDSVFYGIPLEIFYQIVYINNSFKDEENKISFKNFMLIKFLLKSNPLAMSFIISNLLNNFKSNKLNNDSLNYELQKLVKNIDIDTFAKNFQIANNTIDVLAKVSKSDESKDLLQEEFENAKNCLEAESNALSYFKDVIDNMTSFFDIFGESNKNLFEDIIKNLGALSFAFGYVNLIVTAVSFLVEAFLPKTEYISYVFENEQGQKYIWDGGRRQTILWGLVETENVSIEKMKLIGPEKILDSNNKDEYYFNGNKYDDLNLLKKDQLRQIANGTYKNSSIKNVYSWENINGDFTSRPENVFETNQIGNWESILNIDLNQASNVLFKPNNLVQYIYKKISEDLINGLDSSKYFKSSFKFAGGIEANALDKDEIIKKILNEIESVKIVQLPNIDKDNKPIYKNDSSDDGSISVFELPSKSWSFGTTTYNETNNKYIIYDPNIETKENDDEMIDIIKLIERQFYENLM